MRSMKRDRATYAITSALLLGLITLLASNIWVALLICTIGASCSIASFDMGYECHRDQVVDNTLDELEADSG